MPIFLCPLIQNHIRIHFPIGTTFNRFSLETNLNILIWKKLESFSSWVPYFYTVAKFNKNRSLCCTKLKFTKRETNKCYCDYRSASFFVTIHIDLWSFIVIYWPPFCIRIRWSLRIHCIVSISNGKQITANV